MPSVPAQTAHDLSDFASFLQRLHGEGLEYAVIGGCAVAAYADLMGEELYSVDLDIFVTEETLSELLAWAPRHGVRVVKRPRPRNIPVAFLEVDGKEINALTRSTALPEPQVVVRTARQIVLSAHGDLEVPVADPFDLLANKLAVGRDKDKPHIEILRRFVEEEAVQTFAGHDSPRLRLAPARRLLEVLGRDVLPEPLTDRLIAHARMAVDFRFLMGRAPTEEQARGLLARVEARERELQEQLEQILAHRRFERPVAEAC